jgi:hypothetical protein
MAAPVTAIVAYDLAFYEHFGKLTPYVDIAKFAATAPEKIEENAFRNSTLQGAYLIIAARALGLAFMRCPASTIRASIASSFLTGKSNRISVQSRLRCSGQHTPARRTAGFRRALQIL